MSKKITDFRPQSKNVNQHSLHGTRLLEESVQRDGWISAMTAATDGEIFDGSNRINIAAEKFVDKDGNEVEPIIVHTTGDRPVIVVRDDIPSATDPRAKRLSVAANQITATDWNPDGELLKEWGAEDEAIKKLFAESEWTEITGEEKPVQDAEPQIDRAAELLEKWQVKMGDMFAIGEHRLICGDCTDAAVVKRVMGGEKADCVFTSFPYAVGVDYGGTYEDNIENLRKLLSSLSKSFLDVVVDGGFAVLNFGDIASARNIAGTDEPCEYPMALEYYPVFRAAGWLLWSRRIWCKPNARVNSLWCIGSNRAATDWEHIWTFRKKGDAIVKRIDGEFSSAKGWIDTSLLHGVDIGKGEHGAGMALGIVDWMLTTHSRHDSVVQEPFCGTGTTLVSCQNLGRKCRAIEISPAYVAVALERMSQAFPGIEIRRLE